MCDDVALQMKVEELVREKLDACEPFTTADISHPIIKNDASVRHYQVRQIVNEMEQRGEMQAADFSTSTITVFPDGPQTKGVVARLWHPMGFDPADYKSVTKVLIRSGTSSVSPPKPAFVSVSAPVSTPTPKTSIHPASILLDKGSRVQKKNATLNIPTRVVRFAGLKPYDKVLVTTDLPDCKVAIGPLPNTAIPSQLKPIVQRVDKEGRIRLHGRRASLLGKPGDDVRIYVVSDGATKLIKVS